MGGLRPGVHKIFSTGGEGALGLVISLKKEAKGPNFYRGGLRPSPKFNGRGGLG